MWKEFSSFLLLFCLTFLLAVAKLLTLTRAALQRSAFAQILLLFAPRTYTSSPLLINYDYFLILASGIQGRSTKWEECCNSFVDFFPTLRTPYKITLEGFRNYSLQWNRLSPCHRGVAEPFYIREILISFL